MKTKLYPSFALLLINVFSTFLIGATSLRGGGCDANVFQTFSIGGTLNGLSGTLILQNNGSDDLTLMTDGAFTFSDEVASGTSYSVTVASAPSGQTCTVVNGTGIANSDIENVVVTCSSSTQTYTLGGTISGLSGTLILQNSDDQTVEVTDGTSFQFANALADGSPYDVTVATQPSGQNCSVTNGEGTIASSNVTDISVTCFSSTPLSLSVSSLALSVSCPTAGGSCVYSNAALTGEAREIAVTNTSSSYTTTAMTVTPSSLPTGTSVSADTCTGGTLAPLSSCSITITPGQVASSDCTSGIAPTPGTITINASSAPSAVASEVLVLSYGCIYQGGFIYSIDDTTLASLSIGGKTAAVQDTFAGQTSPSAGDPNWGGFGTDVSLDGSTYDNSPQGANDGSANTVTITNVLGCSSSTSPSYAACLCANLSVDAAGSPACTSPSTCYANWYLPAICELTDFFGVCTVGSTNIDEQLFNATPALTANLVDSGYYWSSTEASGSPENFSWGQFFNSSTGASVIYSKANSFGVRCSRIFTP